MHTALESTLVGRRQSFLTEDLLANTSALEEAITGRRILFIGAAGSIGSQTLISILGYKPKSVHVIDHNENGLAELVRFLRASDNVYVPDDFLTLPFDYGSAVFRNWLTHQITSVGRYDFVLNFAALKHVRSEKDPFSILAMLDTNVRKLLSLQTLLKTLAPPERVFYVSTDKAANPSSMMGATKRLMEHALFHDDHPAIRTSARFANVAFSNGSLLQSWDQRLAAGQPLACPKDCRRYFVTLPESGDLCTLAAILGSQNEIIVPRLDPTEHLVLLSDVIEQYLNVKGLTPVFVDTEEEARAAVTVDGRTHPVLLTPLNTAGEKPYEEFIGARETRLDTKFHALDAVTYRAPDDATVFPAFADWLDTLLSGPVQGGISFDSLRKKIALVEPDFATTHRQSTRSLDQRM
jgi:FlaA1/EpsC-like NDP-sugar epimerase